MSKSIDQIREERKSIIAFIEQHAILSELAELATNIIYRKNRTDEGSQLVLHYLKTGELLGHCSPFGLSAASNMALQGQIRGTIHPAEPAFEEPTKAEVKQKRAAHAETIETVTEPPPARQNVSPGKSIYAKLGAARTERILTMLKEGAQPRPKSDDAEAAKYLCKRGDIAFDGAFYYIP